MQKIILGLILSVATLQAQQTQEAENFRSVTLEESIKAALEKNLSIRVESITPQISASLVQTAESIFDPTLQASIQDYDQTTKKTSLYSPSKINQADFNFSLTQHLKSSTNYSISFSNTRQNTDSTFATISPYFDVNLAFRVTQPILKNFGAKIAQTKMLIAMKDQEGSVEGFKSSVTNVLTQVEQVYWGFVASISNLKVQQQSLKLAQDLLGQNKVRVQVGTLAPIDILTSEAEVASREEAILTAQNAVDNYEDQLKSLMNLPGLQQDWSMRIRPADKAEFKPRAVNEEAMLKIALEKRPDLIQLKRSLEGSDINLEYARNQLRPDLSLFAQSGSTGIGGNTFIFDQQTGEKIGVIPGGYGDALVEAAKYKFRNWTFGFNFTLQLKNEASKAALHQATLAQLQSELRIKTLEQQIHQDVRAACRQIDTNAKRVEATNAALRLAEKKLEAEQKKYSVGLSTNYFVLQYQKDLTQAQTNLLQAVTDYKFALIALDKVVGRTLENNNVIITDYLK